MALYKSSAEIVLVDKASGPWAAMTQRMQASATKMQGRVSGAVRGMSNRVNRAMGRMLRSVTRFLPMLGAGGLVYSFISATKAAAAFSHEIAKVSTMLSGRNLGYLPEYEEALQSMAIQFGRTTQDLSDGLYNILSAGIAADKALEHLKVVTKAAVGGFTELFGVTRAVSAIMTAYQSEAVDVTRATDVLAAIVDKGITTLGELAPAIGMVTSSAESAGVTLNDLAGMLATVTKSGVGTFKSVTSLRSMLMALQKPTEDNAQYMTALQNAFERGGAMEFAQILKGMIESGTKMVDIFSDARSQLAVGMLTKNMGFLKESIDASANAASLAGGKFTQMAGNAAFKLAQMREEMTAVRREIGESLLPTILSAAKGFGALTQKIKEFFELSETGALFWAKTRRDALIVFAIIETKFKILYKIVMIAIERIRYVLSRPWKVFDLSTIFIEQTQMMVEETRKMMAEIGYIKGDYLEQEKAIMDAARERAIQKDLDAQKTVLEGAVKTAKQIATIKETVLSGFWSDPGPQWPIEAMDATYRMGKTPIEILEEKIKEFKNDLSEWRRLRQPQLEDIQGLIPFKTPTGEEKWGEAAIADSVMTLAEQHARGMTPSQIARRARLARQAMGAQAEQLPMGMIGTTRLGRFIRKFGSEEGMRQFRAKLEREQRIAPGVGFMRDVTPAQQRIERWQRLAQQKPLEYARRATERIGALTERMGQELAKGNFGNAEAIAKRIGQIEAAREQVSGPVQERLKMLKDMKERLEEQGKEIPKQLEQAIIDAETALGQKKEDPIEVVKKHMTKETDRIINAVKKNKAEATAAVSVNCQGDCQVEKFTSTAQDMPGVPSTYPEEISYGTVPPSPPM